MILFNIGAADEAKDFKYQEKICAFDGELEKINSEIKRVRAKLKTVNNDLKGEKNETLLIKKKNLMKRLKGINYWKIKSLIRGKSF